MPPIKKHFNNPSSEKLCDAVIKGDIKTVRNFLAQQAPLDQQAQNGETALTEALRHGHTEIARLLIDHGADLEKKNAYGTTALIWAAYYNNVDAAYLLVAKGANIHAKNERGDNAQLWAARNNNAEILQLLKAPPKYRQQLIDRKEKAATEKMENSICASIHLQREIPARKPLQLSLKHKGLAPKK